MPPPTLRIQSASTVTVSPRGFEVADEALPRCVAGDQSMPTRTRQTCLVGGDGRLYTIACAELREDAADVCLDAVPSLTYNCAAISALDRPRGDEGEHLAFARGQGVNDFGIVPFLIGQHLDEPLEQASGGGRGDDGVSGCDGSDR
jgi:hypothetical protein